MKALILAAGRGSRLGEYTEDRPKCLVGLDGRTLLDRQVATLRAAGAEEVGVVTGWCADAVRATGLPTFHNPRWADSTMVESLAAADDWLATAPVLVSYGDIVYGAGTARRLAESGAKLAIAYDPDWESLWRNRFERPLDDAETFRLDEQGFVTDIGAKPSTSAEVEGQYLGLLRVTPAAWSVVREIRAADERVRALDMTGLLRHVVRTGLLRVHAVPADGPWCEFDHPSDLDVGRDIVRQLDVQPELAS
jgi:choline kinase